MSKTKNIPTQVKEFITYLKAEGLYKKYDTQKGSLLYHSKDNTSLPFEFLQDRFNKHCPDTDWDDWGNYVKASIDQIIGLTFEPKSSRLVDVGIGAQRLNIYKQFTSGITDTHCPLFLEMLERMLPDRGERHTFTQWLAHMIQCPAERPTWAVMLTSDEGTGKGVLFNNIISPLVRNQTAQCSKYQQFLGDHSTALANTMFVMLDDTKSHSDSVITELKSKISEPTVLLNPKYEQPHTQEVYARVLLASNERRPIKLGKNDTRRWFAPAYIEHRVSKEETQVFYDKLLKWIDSDPTALDCIYNYLNTYSLHGFNAGLVAPTETLKMMVEISESTKETEVKEWVKDNLVYKMEDLTTYFNDYPDLAKSYALNYSQCKSIDLDGKRTRWWIPTDWNTKQAREYWKQNNDPCPIKF